MFHPRAFLKGKRGTRGLEQNRRDASPGPPSDGRKWLLAEIEKVRPGDHLLRLDHVPARQLHVRRGIMGTHEAASASHRGQAHRAGMVASYRAEAKKAAAAARAADLASLIRDIRTLAPPVSAPSPANWTPVKFRQQVAARGRENGANSFRCNGIRNILGCGRVGRFTPDLCVAPVLTANGRPTHGYRVGAVRGARHRGFSTSWFR